MSDKNVPGIDDHTGREVIRSSAVRPVSEWTPPVLGPFVPPAERGLGLYQSGKRTNSTPIGVTEPEEYDEQPPTDIIPVVTGEIVLEGTPDEQADIILAHLSEVERALSMTEDISDLIKLKHITDAVEFLARKSKQELSIQNRATLARAETLRKIGEHSIKMDTAQGKRSDLNLVSGETKLQRLEQVGLTKSDVYTSEAIAKLPRTKQDKYVAEANEAQREITIGGLAVYSRELQKNRAINSSEDTSWYTPPVYIDAARHVLSVIDVDPASSDIANETIRAVHYYTADDDGLQYDWPGKVWLNPPYGPEAKEFIDKLLDQYAAGITTEAIVLLNAHVTETRWFAPLWDYTICFTHGRINFYRPDGTEGAGSNHGSLFVYIGPNNGRFVSIFKQFGPVVRRVDRDY